MEVSRALVSVVWAFLAFALSDSTEVPRKKVVCYYGSWATYRKGEGRFSVDDINPSLCTDLVYAFAGLDDATNSIVSLDKNFDITLGGYRHAVALKKYNPNLQVYISIGGWNEGSEKFSKMASGFQSRAAFIQSTIDFLQLHGFDGLDIDWEYPTARGGVPEDKENFAKLLKELKTAFQKQKWSLTVAISALQSTIESGYNLTALEHYCDYVYVMCYDYHGSWEGQTGHNAPLFAKKDDSFNNKLLTVEHTVTYIINQGFPPAKLVLGLPLYGRTFVLEDPASHGPGAKAKAEGFKGNLTLENGFLGYLEICQLSQDKSWTQAWDAESHVPYMYNGDQWVSFDNEKSLKEKTLFAIQHKLGGVKVWSIEVDDFKGLCSRNRFNLLSTINQVYNEFLEPEGNVIPTNKPHHNNGVDAVTVYALTSLITALTVFFLN